MSKILKRKFIGSIFCFLLGLFVLMYNLFADVNDSLFSYLLGFTVGIYVVGIYNLWITFRSMKNDKKRKELENVEQDERVIALSNEAMARTGKYSILTMAICSFVFAVMNQMNIAVILGYIISFILILYCVIYMYLAHKN